MKRAFTRKTFGGNDGETPGERAGQGRRTGRQPQGEAAGTGASAQGSPSFEPDRDEEAYGASGLPAAEPNAAGPIGRFRRRDNQGGGRGFRPWREYAGLAKELLPPRVCGPQAQPPHRTRPGRAPLPTARIRATERAAMGFSIGCLPGRRSPWQPASPFCVWAGRRYGSAGAARRPAFRPPPPPPVPA